MTVWGNGYFGFRTFKISNSAQDRSPKMRSGRSSGRADEVDQCAEQGDGNQGRKYRYFHFPVDITTGRNHVFAFQARSAIMPWVLLGQPSRPLAYLIRLFPVIPSCAG